MLTTPTLNNAFLNLSSTRLPFDRITAEDVEPGLALLLSHAQSELARVLDDDEPRTFDSAVLALEAAGSKLELAMLLMEHLERVASTPELREAYRAIRPAVRGFFTNVRSSPQCLQMIRGYAGTSDAAGLTGVRRRALDRTLAELARNGAEVGWEKRERLREVERALYALTLRFEQNLLDSTSACGVVVDDATVLAGLPVSAVEAARESARASGLAGLRLSLRGASYVQAITYLDDRTLRERMFRAWTTRAAGGDFSNREVVRSILQLRAEKAKLLGYQSFAEYVCADSMVGSAAEARQFVEDARVATRPRFEEENEELLDFARQESAGRVLDLQAWDVAYYAERLRRRRFSLDPEVIRAYFHVDAVVDGLFALAERLYGIRAHRSDAVVWHPSVRAYRLDVPGGASALVFMDLFAREGKRGGGWTQGLVSALDPQSERHVSIVVANLSPAPDGSVPLLRHDEVETLFHEFGHVLHHAASRVSVCSLAGLKVARDFVEFPSRLMENWCWEEPVLELFARHVATGAPLSSDIIAQLRASRRFRLANAVMRQLGFAALDLGLHSRGDIADDWDVAGYGRGVLAGFSPTALPPDQALVCSFSHLFQEPGGYAASYYAYTWAQMLAADAFERFKEAGLLDRAVGDALRECVLSRGNSEDPRVLFRAFMGRDPSRNALFSRWEAERPRRDPGQPRAFAVSAEQPKKITEDAGHGPR